jgi:acyl-CoA thioesterase
VGAASAFQRQTAVEPDPEQPGRYHAFLNEEWNAPLVPQGGVMAAVAVRAMIAELDLPDHELRSVSTVFAARVPAGPVEIDVTVLRRGRSMSQVMATARPPGQAAGHTSLAVFGGARNGFSFTDLEVPDVPPPDQCPSFRDPAPEGFVREVHFGYWDHVEGRSAIGHAPWDDWEPTASRRAYWCRFDEPPRLDDGRIDPLALVSVCDTMPGAVRERLGPGEWWFSPSADLTVHLLGEARSEWLLAHNRARHAGGGYASAEMELWDPETGLVAYGTQMMFFSFPDGGGP